MSFVLMRIETALPRRELAQAADEGRQYRSVSATARTQMTTPIHNDVNKLLKKKMQQDGNC